VRVCARRPMPCRELLSAWVKRRGAGACACVRECVYAYTVVFQCVYLFLHFGVRVCACVCVLVCVFIGVHACGVHVCGGCECLCVLVFAVLLC
jgi:hypothetical protein